MKLRIFLLSAVALLYAFVCSAQFTLENAVMAEGTDPNPPFFSNEKYIFSYTELAASVVVLRDIGPNDLTIYHEWYRRSDLNNPIWVFEHPIGCCWGIYVSISNRLGSDPDIGFGDFTLKFRIGVTNSGNYPVVATKNFTIQPPVCEASSAPYASVNGHTWLDLQWDDPVGVDGDEYTIFQREKGGSAWAKAQGFSDCFEPQILIFGPKLDGSTYGLKPCTNYEIKILKECKTGGTAESPVSVISTGECGNDYFSTTPLRYAAGKKACSIIESITLANLFDYNGVCDGNIVDDEHGYEFFTQDTARLERGKDYVFDLTTNGRAGTHHAGAWIDYDGNTFFEVNKNERVFVGQQNLSSNCSTWSESFTISIPANAPTGFKRMRIVSSYNTAAQPHAGTMAAGGRVEDIIVEIKDAGSVFQPPAMKDVQGGTFTMGCTDEVKPCLGAENPPHNVTLPDFQIGQYEITQAEWQSLMGANPSSFTNCPNCPVERVSWYDAVVYCNRLSEKMGLQACYYADAAYKQVYGKSGNNWNMPNTGPVFWKRCADGYRLPTEAEWEFVARGGNQDAAPKTAYPGSNNVGAVAWYKNNSNTKTNPVGQKQANELGVYDLGGNVWEWCYDWYNENFYAASTCCTPVGPVTGTTKITRGGSWFDDETSMRVTHRNGDLTNTPDRRVDTNRGFRVVRGNGGDSLALVRLYQSTNGPSWVNKWNLNTPVSQWYGISMDQDGCVDTIALAGNGLAGILPQQIGNFAHLRLLRLSTNFITGSIPQEIGQLTGLLELNLSQNKSLGGSIPASLGQLAQLNALYLNECNFSGIIPSELGLLSNLQILNLSKNKLTTNATLNVGAWSKLKECYWNENQFSGPLPTGFAGLPQLKHLNLSINNYDGAIPAAYGNLTGLDSLFLNNNQLSGCLNPTLKNLCPIKKVSIAANPGLATQDWFRFCNFNEGLCAPSKCDVKRDSAALAKLYEVTGGPTTWAKRDNWLQKGKKIGEWYGIKTNTEGCVQCIGLDGDSDPCNALGGLPGNGLTGQIPKEIGNFTELEVLNLYGNKLSGSMPKELGLLSKLKNLVLDNNTLTGTIPPELGNLGQLVSIGIGANQIGGTIPSDLANAKALQYLFFQNNKNISGSIPPQLFSLPELKGLFFQDNNLNGPVPAEILQAKKLETFFIAKNKITDLPNISSLPFIPDGPIPNYNGLRIANNKLTFKHILPNMTALNQFINNSPQTRYAPQDDFFSDTTITRNAGQTLTIDLGIDAAVTGNRYQWFKGNSAAGQPLLTTNQRTFPNLQLSDAGTYYVQVTNPGAPLLTLKSRIITIQVIPDPGACNPKNDSLELVKFYNATNGLGWSNNTNWLVKGKKLDDWWGINTNTAGCVIRVSLSDDKIEGIMPDLNLPFLEVLSVTNSNLKGTLPAFSQLLNLREVYLYENELSGNLPSFSGLNKISLIDVDNNQFSGAVPNYNALKELIYMDLGYNQLSGSIPNFDLPQLILLDLNQNNLSGNMPAFDKVPNLQTLGLAFNRLSGFLPDFSNLTKLNRTFLNNNDLSGKLPSFNQMPKLDTVVIDNNKFTFDGMANLVSKNYKVFAYVPQDSFFTTTTYTRQAGQPLTIDLGIDAAVTGNRYQWFKGGSATGQPLLTTNQRTFPNLQLSDAGTYYVQVTNPGAPLLTLKSRIITIQVIPDPGACNPKNDSLELVKFYNATGGPNWKNKWDLSKPMKTWYGVTVNANGCVTCLDLDGDASCSLEKSSGNGLKGTLPDISLPNLQSLFLSKNQLSGSIPNFNNLPNLKHLLFAGNQMSGNIPNFQSLPNLEVLVCDSNQLSGSIPDFNHIPNLQEFYCSYNPLSGSIPDFKNLPNLRVFVCAHNSQLTGGIPDFSNLPNLTVLDCPANNLTGNIPNFTKLPNLIGFYCWGNKLSGNIPDFDKLPNLTRFSCIDNDLSGSIPNFKNLPKLEIFNCASNRLSGVVPDFKSQKNLNLIFCTNNQFTFKDILPTIAGIETAINMSMCAPGPLCDYRYELQDSVFHDTLLIRNAGQNLDFSLDFDENVGTNVYKWYKDGVYQSAQDQIGNNNLKIPGLQPVHAGNWTVEVINPGAHELTLYSRTIRLQVGCTGAQTPVIQGPSNLCNGSATLTVNGSYQSWKWSGSITQQTASVTVNAPGTYTVTTTDANGCTATASISIGASVALPTAKIEGSGAICGTLAAVLNAGSAGITAYAWSTGSTSSAISVLNVGTYSVTVKNSAGCTATTQITTQVFPAPPLSIALLAAICDGNPAKIQVNQNYPKYEWSGGQNTKQISPTMPGVYTVTITDANTCTATATRNVIIGPKITVDLGADLGRCILPGAGIKLDAGPADAYSWSTGSNLNVITVKQFGEYAVTVTNTAGCTDSDTIKIYLKEAIKVQKDTFLCPGVTLKYCGITILKPGKYECPPVVTVEGCDSIQILQVLEFDSTQLETNDDVYDLINDPQTVEIAILDNDKVPLRYKLEVIQEPTQGKASILPDGQLRYEPQSNATGKDSLQYEICPDGACPALCEQAWLFIRFQAGEIERIKKLIPNFITPDDDGAGTGLNDVFDPVGILEQNEIFPNEPHLYLLNRWGEVVYDGKEGEARWDGRKNGHIVPKGAYYYVLSFKVGNEKARIKGVVNVVR